MPPNERHGVLSSILLNSSYIAKYNRDLYSALVLVHVPDVNTCCNLFYWNQTCETIST